jgi:hypothetical protein
MVEQRHLLALVGNGHDPVFFNLTLDAHVLGYTAVTSLLAGILFGQAPAWRHAHTLSMVS